MANLIVEISWDAGVAVKLVSLRDNSVELLKTSLRDDDGKITLEWETGDTIAHFIDWDLWSGSETMKGLKVTAHWEHGKPKVLGQEKEMTGRWRAGGDL